MSKNHREARKPVLADWTVHHADGRQIIIAAATFRRDGKGGYTFRDSCGICADFPPGMVLRVTRTDPDFSTAQPGDVLESLDSRA